MTSLKSLVSSAVLGISVCIHPIPLVALFCIHTSLLLLQICRSADDGACGFFSDSRRCGGTGKSLKPLSFTCFGKKVLRLWQSDCRTWCLASDVRAGQVRATSACEKKAGLLPLHHSGSFLVLCSAGGRAATPQRISVTFLLPPSDTEVRELKGQMKQWKAGPCGQ